MMCRVALFAVLALFVVQGEAIKCHQCSSATDTKCSDPVDSSLPLTECTPSGLSEALGALHNAADKISGVLGSFGVDANLGKSLPDEHSVFACVKAVKQDGDKKVVVRSCSIPANEKFDVCKSMKASGGLVTFCETCDSDGCNGASGLAPSSLLLGLLAALAAYLALSKQ